MTQQEHAPAMKLKEEEEKEEEKEEIGAEEKGGVVPHPPSDPKEEDENDENDDNDQNQVMDLEDMFPSHRTFRARDEDEWRQTWRSDQITCAPILCMAGLIVSVLVIAGLIVFFTTRNDDTDTQQQPQQAIEIETETIMPTTTTEVP
ncbi:expressed unknown protein [Seminavis robusta]|uniref:Uncharacterized protein n=1 Tax=Seminavis robusta TaxID=568900 RepID=A0A9N8EEK0_9STRA|nr:expressed unknown protein [Seminavis robusta]|eukprot:Sro823_g207570.1 n/a (147) ;mRNA; f:27058-27498